jgi:hypothetical protein
VALVIGMDEAGYGPNLGPLVVTATVWEVPGHPRDTDFWSHFAEVCCASPEKGDARLHVADSKQVYNASRGLASLERSVLAALSMGSIPCRSFHELWRALTRSDTRPACRSGQPRSRRGGDKPAACHYEPEPWFDGDDLPLPHSPQCDDLTEPARRWRDCCDRSGLRLRGIRSDLVLTNRFNNLTRAADSKGIALSRISLQLLRSVWQPGEDEPAWIIADKHGGRNRYDDLLAEILDGEMIFRLREGTERSVYRVGRTEVRFQTRAEEHFPVALASMVSKYLRELAMVLFNRFWSRHVPDLKPTAGYPTDAWRFREAIAAAQQTLGISDDVLWRER